MVNYECKVCSYVTDNKNKYQRHNTTKKHMEKVKTDHDNNNYNISNFLKFTTDSHTTHKRLANDSINHNYSDNKLLCDYCKRPFARYNNLVRHTKSCVTKKKYQEDNTLKGEIKELNMKLQQYEKDAQHHTAENKHYKEEVDYYKNMLMEAGELVKKSVSALTYSIQNYNDAPSIKAINIDLIETFDGDDKKITEDILSAYKHKTLNKYLGEMILKLYKKEDPKHQSIWNTDNTRLTYLIKELLNNKSSNWVVDRKGIKTIEYLIDPVLEHIKKLLTFYQYNYTVPEKGQNITEMEMVLENSKKILELINDIDDGIVAKDALKFISSHLKFNDNKSLK